MAKILELNGTVLVNNYNEAVKFYSDVFGMKETEHHGEPRMELNGKLFFHLREVKSDEAETFLRVSYYYNDKFEYDDKMLSCGIEFETEDEVRTVYEKILSDGGRERYHSIITLPWSPCSADVIDKYGVNWGITMPQEAPPANCMHPPLGDGCYSCKRWSEPNHKCPNNK